MKRVAVDIGGTFTDCFICWDERLVQAKALTNHRNLSVGFNEALDSACRELDIDRRTLMGSVDSVRYATTLATNAIIERKGARVGLLTTHGFESTVPIARGRGYADGLPRELTRDLGRAKRPEPIVPIRMIRAVRERVNYAGEILLPLDIEGARRQFRSLMDAGAEAIVVALVNSVANPEHELQLQELFLEEYPPQMLGAVPLVLSHQVSGQKGEYVRAISSIIDAYLHSTMYYSMAGLEQNLRENGYGRPMLLVHNTGGMAQINSTDALQTVNSGPVAGIYAAETIAKQTSVGNLICGDMGGTSFDIGMVIAGGQRYYDLTPVVDRWLVSMPMMHLVTLGAGGGSIARYDDVFHTISVGPQSAGSEPGPACYDAGGLDPTITDADLLLGYLDKDNYAGGQIALNARRSVMALQDICDELDIEPTEAARRIRQIAVGDMAAGMSRELSSRGYKGSDFTFLAYGGNGPLHACSIAKRSGIGRVLIPPFSPVFAASGCGGLDQIHIHQKTASIGFYNKGTRSILGEFNAVNRDIEELERRGVEDLIRQEVARDQVQHRLEFDIRYGIQRMEITVPSPKRRIENQTDVLHIIELMNKQFGERYGHEIVSPESGVWATTIRVISWVELPALRFEDIRPPERKIATPQPVGERMCYFVDESDPVMTPVYDGAALQPGVLINGPAIVNPGHTTYLVESEWRFESAAQGAAWLFDRKVE